MNALINLPDSELQRLIAHSTDPAVRQAALMMLTQRRTAVTTKLPAVVTQSKPVQDTDVDISFDWD